MSHGGVSRQLLQPQGRKRGKPDIKRVWDKESSRDRHPDFVRVLKPRLHAEIELLGKGV